MEIYTVDTTFYIQKSYPDEMKLVANKQLVEIKDTVALDVFFNKKTPGSVSKEISIQLSAFQLQNGNKVKYGNFIPPFLFTTGNAINTANAKSTYLTPVDSLWNSELPLFISASVIDQEKYLHKIPSNLKLNKMDETNDSTISSKTAIVVIHGMGNQYPMETITDFVDNLFKIEENKDKDDNPKSIYSAPERITGSFDQRKLIGFHNNVQYDCYEYYWAHLIKEPSVSDTISWMYKLIWKKEPSERLNKYISIIRRSSIGLLLLISIIIFFYYWLFTWIISCCPLWSRLFFFIVSVVAFYKLRNIFRLLTQSFGDVIRYTVAPFQYRRQAKNIQYCG
ncbi:MAG: hypothetical protein IPL25_07105 [Saprospiraceae bacterium]|nr:hypothetical protein [Candidatus Vicinibacter affinis]